ncbi:hypothetical protein MTY414_23140 [Mycolicibacterium mageritense]|nr:hypothetical protein MTY414_23140 [Mycolicibacterium mageritense]
MYGVILRLDVFVARAPHYKHRRVRKGVQPAGGRTPVRAGYLWAEASAELNVSLGRITAVVFSLSG